MSHLFTSNAGPLGKLVALAPVVGIVLYGLARMVAMVQELGL